ncbi:hypothetical protein HRbin41_00917 [bacterium HR41]|nr:hypothetical protein HRbin41_00917 [bacterium HR41]
MRLFRRNRESGDGVAVADKPASSRELLDAVAAMAADNRRERSLDKERELLRLRHRAANALIAETESEPPFPEPNFSLIPEGETLPEFTPEQLSPELIRAGMLRQGCVLVRGLFDRAAAERMAQEIDRAFAVRERALAGEGGDAAYYEPFDPPSDHEVNLGVRAWVREGGGLLAADAPKLAFDMFEMFDQAGILDIVGGYLGEHPLISIEKTTLRKAEPQVPGAWHQDGRFMGPVRALNMWVSLSRCGDISPGLDIVPKRLEHYLATQTDEAVLDYQISQKMAEEAAGDLPILRPIFEPGDVLFFDEMFLHQTGSDPSMPNPRYAIECWFFGGSKFPQEYGALAV